MRRTLLLCLLIPFFTVYAETDWPELKQRIRDRFPEARQVSLTHYQQNPDLYILIDTREEEEYNISHLPGALHMQDEDDVAALAQANPEKILLLYCSVGYRSSSLVEELYEDGTRNIANLEGSAFEWANSGLNLENEDGTTRYVHPYNKRWGQYLKREYWRFD